MEKETNEILKHISDTLDRINTRKETEELFSESNKLLESSDSRVENALNQIQNSFDRIHDKVFNFNNILIGAYLVLGTYPSISPIINIWTVVFPVTNLLYLVYIDFRQMEIHRFASKEQDWTSKERLEYKRRIKNQTLLSLIALELSLACLIYLIIKLT